MKNSLIDRFKAITDAAIKNDTSHIVHHISRSCMRNYRLEVIELLESTGISFYEDKPFREMMFREYHDKIVSKGILELKIIKDNEDK